MKLRPELTELPLRMRALPIDARGYPVPWFAGRTDGKPKWYRAIHQKACWICGQKLGAHLCFVIDVQDAFTRTVSEPPSHRQCAEWFIRNRENSTDEWPVRRPTGVFLVWMAKDFAVFESDAGRSVIHIGDAEDATWWMDGRHATLEEAEDCVEREFALLELAARDDKDREAKALVQLYRHKAELELLYPRPMPAPAIGM